MKTKIGNIEFRLVTSVENNSKQHIEIICWTPNILYGKENEFEKDVQNDTCFSEKEVCYTIATINIEKHPDVKSCSLRAFQLNEQDDKDFKKLVIYAYQYAVRLWKENSLA